VETIWKMALKLGGNGTEKKSVEIQRKNQGKKQALKREVPRKESRSRGCRI